MATRVCGRCTSAKCPDCMAARVCGGCGESKEEGDFSEWEWARGSKRECTACKTARKTASAALAALKKILPRVCRGCGESKEEDDFSEWEWKNKGAARECTACKTASAASRAASRRKKTSGPGWTGTAIVGGSVGVMKAIKNEQDGAGGSGDEEGGSEGKSHGYNNGTGSSVGAMKAIKNEQDGAGGSGGEEGGSGGGSEKAGSSSSGSSWDDEVGDDEGSSSSGSAFED